MKYMLVRLHGLPDIAPLIEEQRSRGINIRKPVAPEKHVVKAYVKDFGEDFVDECEIAFSNHPASCFIAVKGDAIVGFGCYDVTAKDFCGPVITNSEVEYKIIKQALLLSCLHAMAENGYAFAIIPISSEEEVFLNAVGDLKLNVKMEGFI